MWCYVCSVGVGVYITGARDVVVDRCYVVGCGDGVIVGGVCYVADVVGCCDMDVVGVGDGDVGNVGVVGGGDDVFVVDIVVVGTVGVGCVVDGYDVSVGVGSCGVADDVVNSSVGVVVGDGGVYAVGVGCGHVVVACWWCWWCR